MRSATGGRRLTMAALASREYVINADCPISRKELAAAARDAMKALSMRPALRLVLGELVGCWGETMVKDRVMVWPSNEYLVARTGLSERSVRYGMRGLIQLQVVTPRDSANGKRFSIKGAGGEVLDAFGFDLTPIYARRVEWAERVTAQNELAAYRRALFDEITICRRAGEEALDALATHYPEHPSDDIRSALAELVARTPRRSASAEPEALKLLAEEYRVVRERAELSFYQAGSGGNSCRLIESSTHPHNAKKQEPPEKAWVELPSPPHVAPSISLIVEACPVLAMYGRPIETEADLIDAGRFLRGSLGAHVSAWAEACEALGPLRAAATVVYVLQIHQDDITAGTDRIKNPGGYFRALVRLMSAYKFNLQVELMGLRRKHLM